MRKALEQKTKLANDEVNHFIETIEETRYFTMPFYYEWSYNEEGSFKIIKSMTSKIFALGSDFLNQYFPLGDVCPIIKQFSQ